MTGNAAPPQPPERRHLSSLFPQIERIEGSRAQALKALALFMDEKQAMCQALSAHEVGTLLRVERVVNVRWVQCLINPEENSAVGIATYSYPGRAKNMKRRGEIRLEGIQIVELEVDRRWPRYKVKTGITSRPLPSVEAVHRFLEGFANGTITKADCKVAAEKNFGADLAQKNIWLPAWRLLDNSKKVKQGMHPKAGKPATAK